MKGDNRAKKFKFGILTASVIATMGFGTVVTFMHYDHSAIYNHNSIKAKNFILSTMEAEDDSEYDGDIAQERIEIGTKVDLSEVEKGETVQITFPDSNLYEIIKNALLNDESYQVTESDDETKTITIYDGILNSITSITINGKNIQDIRGIEQFKNLEELDLVNNQIDTAQLETIQKISSLKILDLSCNQLTESLDISALTNLEELYAENNRISNIESLSQLGNLKIISLINNEIKDMSSIINLTQLKNVYLDNNQIEKIYNIEGIEKLSIKNQKFVRYVVGDRQESISIQLPEIFAQSQTQTNQIIQENCEEISEDTTTVTVNPYTAATSANGAIVKVTNSAEGTDSMTGGTTLVIKGVSIEYYILNNIEEQDDNTELTIANPSVKTNKDIVAKVISTNQEIEEQSFTFQSNGTHTFYVTVNKEEEELVASVNFINKDGISYEVQYSTKRPTNGEVTVRIIADRELINQYYEEIVDEEGETQDVIINWGYEYDMETDRTTLTKTFSENTSGTVLLQDELGNEQEAEYNITNITDDPVRDSMIIKEENAEGENYIEGSWTNKNIYVEKRTDDLQLGEERSLFYVDDQENETEIKDNITLTESGQYTIMSLTKESNGNTFPDTVVINIDKELPTQSRLEAKLNAANGAEYKSGTTTDQNVYINIIEGEDQLSGIEKYSFIINEKEEYDSFVILQRTGTYQIVTKTIDKAGNIATSEPFTVVIDKTKTQARVEYVKNNNNTVTAKIILNRPVETLSGWQSSEENGNYILTKTYKTNQQEKVTLTDLFGNTTEVTIQITGIITEDLIVFISYSSTQMTANDVTVTLTANRAIQNITGWSLDSAKLKLTKTFHENTTQEVTITDEIGKTKTVSIEIKNIDKIKPILEVVQQNQEWTQGDITLTIKAVDQDSGLKNVTVNGSTIVMNSGIGYYKVLSNGTYNIIATDKVENSVTKEIQVDNIDKVRTKIRDYTELFRLD